MSIVDSLRDAGLPEDVAGRVQTCLAVDEILGHAKSVLRATGRDRFGTGGDRVLDDLSLLLDRAARSVKTGEEIQVDDLVALRELPRLADGATERVGNQAGAASDAALAATGFQPQPHLVGIFFVWRDLDDTLWPSILQAIPITLRTVLNLVLKQIEAQSRGVIRAELFTAIQPAQDMGATLLVHFDLVIPAFIVDLFQQDPEYRETVELRGRSFMLGVPVAGRPIIRPLVGTMPGMAPGAPLVPLGRPLTGKSLLAPGAWRQFIDDLERGVKELGLHLAESLITRVATGLLENVMNNLGTLVSDRTSPTLARMGETLRSAIEATPIDELMDTGFGRALASAGTSSLHFLQELTGVFKRFATMLSSAGGALGGFFVGFGQELAAIAGGELEHMLARDLVFRPLYETLFDQGQESVYAGAGKGLFKLFEGTRRIGFLTRVERPESPRSEWPTGTELGPDGYGGHILLLDKLAKGGKPQGLLAAHGRPKLDLPSFLGMDLAPIELPLPGTPIVIDTPSGEIFREIHEIITGADGKLYVRLSTSSTIPGVSNLPLPDVAVGSPVFVATNYAPGMDLDQLKLALVYLTLLEQGQKFLEGELGRLVDLMFLDTRKALAEDDPKAFTAQIESSVERISRDALARLLGAADWAELDRGSRRFIIRALPAGQLGGRLTVTGPNSIEWLLPGAGLPVPPWPGDPKKYEVKILVSGDAHPSNNGEFGAVVLGPDRIQTEAGFLVAGQLSSTTVVRLAVDPKDDPPKILFWTADQLRHRAIRLTESIVAKAFKKNVEKRLAELLSESIASARGLHPLLQPDGSLDSDGLSIWMFQQANVMGGWSGRTLTETIDFHVNRFAGALVGQFGGGDFLDVRGAVEAFIEAQKDERVPGVAGGMVPNPVHFDLEAIATDVATAAVGELIGRAFIVSVVVGFELTGGRSPEGGGVMMDWAAGLFMLNKIHGNLAEGSGDGGGVYVRGYLPVVFLANEIVENRAKQEGGGVYLDSSFSTWALNTVEDNEADRGGGFALSRKALSIGVWNSVEGNRAREGGGLATESEFGLWLANELSGNEAEVGGGAFIAGRSWYMHNQLTGNRAGVGGGVAYGGTCRADAERNLIKGNVAQKLGGGVAVLGPAARPRIATDRIARNHADKGGGIYVDAESRPKIQGARISGNSAREGGGVYAERASWGFAKLVSASIYGNRAERGGGMWLGRDGGVLGCDVSGNVATDTGGGLYAEGVGAVHLQGTTLAGNWANASGGGAAIVNSGSLWAHGCVISDNRVFRSDGAGIWTSDVNTVTIESCDFVHNFTELGGNGGGLAVLRSARARLARSSLKRNGTEHARGSTAGIVDAARCSGGGAWFRECGAVGVADSWATGNGAERGGAVALHRCAEVGIVRSVFAGNLADLNQDGFGLGGAIFATGQGSLIRIGGDPGAANHFTGNTAGTAEANRSAPVAAPEGCGGAIAVDQGPSVLVEGNQFDHNAATDIGGAIFFRDTGPDSRIGGRNAQPPPLDPAAAGRERGNLGEEGCAVTSTSFWPEEAAQPHANDPELHGPPEPAFGVRKLVLGLADPALLAGAIREAQDVNDPLGALVARRLDVLRQPLWTIWPAERDTTSQFETVVRGNQLVPPWPPTPGWAPDLGGLSRGWSFDDARPSFSRAVRSAPREIVTRLGGLFGIVRGEGTAVVGNWFRTNYATQQGGAGYVAASDARTTVGGATDGANLFRLNASSLGGGLALVAGTACVVRGNTVGGGDREHLFANYASVGGGIYVADSKPLIIENSVVGNLAGHLIAKTDAAAFPAELSAWVRRGLLAFGGGIAVTGRGAAIVEKNRIAENEILAVPVFDAFVPPLAGGVAASVSPAGVPPKATLPLSVRRHALRFSALAPSAGTPRVTVALPDGRWLFGAGVALLETANAVVRGNEVVENRITVPPAQRVQPALLPLCLAGAGVAVVLADPPKGKRVELGGHFAQNRLVVPHDGIRGTRWVARGGAVAVIASRRVALTGAKLADNVVEHEASPGKTPPVEGSLAGGGLSAWRCEELELTDSRFTQCDVAGLDALFSGAGGAVALEDVAAGRVERVVIGECFSHRDGGGVALAGITDLYVRETTVADCVAMNRGEAIYLAGDASTSRFENLLLRGFPGRDGAVVFRDATAAAPRVKDVAVEATTGPAVRGALAHVDLLAGFVSGDAADWDVLPGSAAANRPSGGPYGAARVASQPGNVPRRIRVPQDRPTIREGLAAARPGDVVEVAAGRWREAGLVVPEEVVLRGASADTTFLEQDPAAPAPVAITVVGVGRGTAVVGFTVRPGPATGVEVVAGFRGTLAELVIEQVGTGIRIAPAPALERRLSRARITNVTLTRCELGIDATAALVTEGRAARVAPCRAPAPPLRPGHRREARDPILDHVIIEDCGIALRVVRADGTPVSSSLVSRVNVHGGVVKGYVPDILALNDNSRDDPYLLPPPKPEEHHPRQFSGSAVLPDGWPDERTEGALPPFPPRPVP